MQTIGVIPYRSAALVLARTVSSDSPCSVRRSEWPTTTNVQPSLASIEPLISPVYAPDSWAETSWAP